MRHGFVRQEAQEEKNLLTSLVERMFEGEIMKHQFTGVLCTAFIISTVNADTFTNSKLIPKPIDQKPIELAAPGPLIQDVFRITRIPGLKDLIESHR